MIQVILSKHFLRKAIWKYTIHVGYLIKLLIFQKCRLIYNYLATLILSEEREKTAFADTQCSQGSFMNNPTQPEFSSVSKPIDISKVSNYHLTSDLLLSKSHLNDASSSINLGHVFNKPSSDANKNTIYFVQDSAISNSISLTGIQKESSSFNCSNSTVSVATNKTVEKSYNSLTEALSLPPTQVSPAKSLPYVQTLITTSGPLISSATVTTEFLSPVTANSSQDTVTILDKDANTVNISHVHENDKSSGQLSSCSADIPIVSASQSASQVSSQVLSLNPTQLPVSQAEPEPFIPPIDTVILPINSKTTFSSLLERPLKKPKFENGLRKQILQVLEEPSFWDFVSASNLP